MSGDYAYVAAKAADRLTVVDISNPQSPGIQTSLKDATQLQSLQSVSLAEKYAYGAASGSHRLAIIDLFSSENE